MDNNMRYYLAEIGADYHTVFKPTPKPQLDLIMSVLADASCMVEVEHLGNGHTTTELIPGPGELDVMVTPVNDYLAYKHPGGDIFYFSVKTGVSSCGEYQLLYMACGECGEEILPENESGIAFELEGMCPKCYFEDKWRVEQTRIHAEKITKLNHHVPGLGDMISNPFPTSR